MKLSLILLAGSTLAQASQLASRQDGNGSDEASAEHFGRCPVVWNTISRELTGMFRSGAQCNDDARAAIRAIFHDCFPDGGCDGSLVLPAEINRDANRRLSGIAQKYKSLSQKYRVSVADLIAFGGCKLGP